MPELPGGQGSKYKALAEATRAAIADGTLAVGQKLPPVRELAWALKITPGTVARAYSLLTDDGVLEAAVGRGTFVAPPKPTPLPELRYERAQPVDSEHVPLTSPRLPDAGQVGLIRRHMAAVAADAGSELLRYPTRDAAAPARRAMMQWLGQAPLGPLDERDLVLTNGSQNAISLILQTVLRGPRPVVLVEDLAYPGFRRAAEMLRAEVVPVAMDAHGLIPEALEAATRGVHAQVLCTSPELHNPTGIFTPYERRRDLAEVIRNRDLQVIEDDTYRLGDSQAPCYRMLLPERGWYVNSVSKLISPALRIGMGIAPKARATDLSRAVAHGFFGLSVPLKALSERLLTDPALEQAQSELRATMNRYIEAAVNQLGRYDLQWRHDMPYMWLRLPAGWRAGAFTLAAETVGVPVRAAEEFACRDARAPHAVRLAINAQVSLSSFEAALQRLRGLLDSPPERISV